MQVLTQPWYQIRPLWQGNDQIIKQGLPFNRLSPYWQMFLLGDGAPTRHLQLLTQSEIVVDVVQMVDIGASGDDAPPEIQAIPAPRVRRQIWLKSVTGEVFSHATSWWCRTTIAEHLQNPALPIWKSLNQKHTELYRDLKQIYYGHCPGVEATFNLPGPYWGRHYLLWHGGAPITLIYEVYSPLLQKYLGSPIM
ncbi:MAG: chorismate lyase [Cyanobacteria bacterium KgW148]|nr:chorismate lyase [Cyanobacteria bacterium KgW148]